jgi:hypothetical protein
LNIKEADDFYRAASYVLSLNLVHGDSLEMRTYCDAPITFAEWEYLSKGKFRRRDFQLDVLIHSNFVEQAPLIAKLSNHETPKPTKSYPPMTVRDLARAAMGTAPRRVAA